jgi:hypothetical protein
MIRKLRLILGWPARYYLYGSLGIVIFSAVVIHAQVLDRRGFARGELHREVVERWGAPIVQPAPSVRYVESGTVFNTLHPLPLESQSIRVASVMNYRKRGLVYFSGFDFDFTGQFRMRNPEAHEIDVVFVFPLQLARRSLLSDLVFTVDGESTTLPLSEQHDKLSWTGRLAGGEAVEFEIAFRGRGLDAFTYQPDPALPVRGFDMEMHIAGGDNFDYGPGVLPAHEVQIQEDAVTLRWTFASLESGFPVGVILPSEKSYDSIMLTMTRRSWATYLIFFAAIAALAMHRGKRLERVECYLIASAYAFFFVLLPYLAAYMSFYAAYAISIAIMGLLLHGYLQRCLPGLARWIVPGLIVALLVVPTLAVVLQGYTGLIYALEILLGLAALMFISTMPSFRNVMGQLESDLTPKENSHVVL